MISARSSLELSPDSGAAMMPTVSSRSVSQLTCSDKAGKTVHGRNTICGPTQEDCVR